jgi:hypothetical protein
VGHRLWSRMGLKNPGSTGIRTWQLPQRSGWDLNIEQLSALRSEPAAGTKRERGVRVFRCTGPSGSEALGGQSLPLIFELLLSRNPEGPQGS